MAEDELKQLLEMASAHFQTHKETVVKINRDPVVRQWLALGFEAHASALFIFNFQAVFLTNTRKAYSELGKKIVRQLDRCENELGNLKTEFSLQKNNSNTLTSHLHEMQATCEAVQGLIKEFRELAQVFRDADATIRAKLTLANLMPLARASAGGKAEIFDSGHEIYRLATRDDTQPARDTRINELAIRASEIQTALERLEWPGLPGIAKEIVAFQIDKAARSTRKIRDFVEEANGILQADLRQFESLNAEIAQCRKAGINEILTQVPILVQNLCKATLDLTYLSHLPGHLQFFSSHLQDLRILHRVIRNDFLPALVTRIADYDSPLNPAVLAQKKASRFFSGLPGLIRTIKLLFASLSGQKAISDLELQGKICDAINHCPLYSGKSPAEVNRMEEFIRAYLDGYPKPFPYDSLFHAMKKALAVYGDRVEYFFVAYKINPDRAAVSDDTGPGEEFKLPTSLGSLMNRIEKRLAAETKI